MQISVCLAYQPARICYTGKIKDASFGRWQSKIEEENHAKISFTEEAMLRPDPFVIAEPQDKELLDVFAWLESRTPEEVSVD